MNTYAIAADEHYGWLTGITQDGRQLLAADDVHLYFDHDGAFLKFESVERDGNWQERAMKLIARPMPILVQEFQINERDISVRPIPESYARFLRNPESFSAEEQLRYTAAVADWQKSQLFEFKLGDDFWMTPDGNVNSH
jgi:hypothetical protein